MFNFPAFDLARDHLLSGGFNVISPADLDRNIGFDPAGTDDIDLGACVRRDVGALSVCDGVVMLPGFDRSRGAQAEAAVMAWLGRPIFRYPDGEQLEIGVQFYG
jgi:hypothetical protein